MAKGRNNMSDDDMDFDDELLSVIEKKPAAKKRKDDSDEEVNTRGGKRGKATTTTTTGRGKTLTKAGGRKGAAAFVEDDEEEPDDGYDQDLYKDEEDRIELSKLPEVEREDILASRYEKRKELRERWEQQKRLKKAKESENRAKGGSQSSSSSAAAADYESSRGSRRGDKEGGKTDQALKDLKQKREKAQSKPPKESSVSSSSTSTKRPPSPSYHYNSSEDQERERQRENEKEREKENREREKERETAKEVQKQIEALDIQTLNQVKLSRNMLVKWVDQPYFETLTPGFFVRVVIGSHLDNPIYRIGEILDIRIGHKLYTVENKETDKILVLSYAGAKKDFSIENVSNNVITPSEHERWITDMVRAGQPLPDPQKIQEKIKDIQKANDYVYTNEDIEKRAKDRARYNKVPVNIAFEKAKLIAIRDTLDPNSEKYQDVCDQIEEYTKLANDLRAKVMSSSEDGIAKINQRNKSFNFRQQYSQTMPETVNNEFDPFARRKTRSIAVVQVTNEDGSKPITAAASSPSAPKVIKNIEVEKSEQKRKPQDYSLQEIHKAIELEIKIPDTVSKILSVQPLQKKRPTIPVHVQGVDHSFKSIITIEDYFKKIHQFK
ncbi:hypothetical protein CYY_001140 [Polysphondylium violaceum]|uniref:Plus3 domain-containing protein n=1 Tax=Polysphondylium violaceum TaxID=133409 RepID=A0A8J4V870_9MYCE|nr:hypothetical protein CYY_001140 [Polysphondylium violaceum]